MNFITSQKEYQEVYDRHSKKHGKFFTFLIQEIPEDTFSVGIIVSKRVGKAVKRNKVKRRVRAYLREFCSQQLTRRKVVIIAKPEAGAAGWQEIKEDLNNFFHNKFDENF